MKRSVCAGRCRAHRARWLRAVGAEVWALVAPEIAKGAEVLEVTVQGRPLVSSHVQSEPGLSSTVVSGEALLRPGETAPLLLSRLPSVQVTRVGGQGELATASIRGAGAAQLPVYLAGVRLNDDVAGTADLSSVPLWLLSRVEVYRGHAPARADQLGIAGAVFFEPRLPRDSSTAAGALVGSFGERAGFVSYETGAEHSAALVGYRRHSSQNDYAFIQDDGQRFMLREYPQRRTNADFSTHDAWAIGQLHRHSTRLRWVLNGFEREQGVTGISILPAQNARGRTQRFLVGATAERPCPAAQSTCRMELSASFLSAGVTLRDPFLELPTLRTTEVTSQGQRQNARAALALGTLQSSEWTLSVNQSAEALDVVRLGNAPRSAWRSSGSVGAGVRLAPWQPLTLHALGQLHCHESRASWEVFGGEREASEQFCAEPSIPVRVGLHVDLAQGLELFTNVGRYERLPTLAERYGYAPAVDGNPNLLPERAVSVELGVRGSRVWERVEVSCDAAAFTRWAEGLIAYRRTNLATVAPFNVTDARVVGAELVLAGAFFRHVLLGGNLTLLHPQETTENPTLDPTVNDILPHVARLSAAASAELYTHQPERWPWVSRAGAGLQLRHQASRFGDPAGLIVLPPQTTLGAHAAMALVPAALTFRAQVENLWDERQFDLIGLPLAGRSVHLSIDTKFH